MTTPKGDLTMPTDDDAKAPAAANDSFRVKRRTFVGASVAAGGAVAAMGLLDGCSERRAGGGFDVDGGADEGQRRRIVNSPWTTAPRCWTCCASTPS